MVPGPIEISTWAIIIIATVFFGPALLLPLLTGVITGLLTHRVRRGFWAGLFCGLLAFPGSVFLTSVLGPSGGFWVGVLLPPLAGSWLAVAIARSSFSLSTSGSVKWTST